MPSSPLLADDAAGVGLPAALRAAGLDDVKVFGQARTALRWAT
ncbi:hypothetical protein [Amycolatopsis sp. NPDC051372]